MQNNFLQDLTLELQNAPVNSNKFFLKFRDEFLTEEQLKKFAEQYFWFCQNFITVLIGLIYNTPVSQEDVRLELIKTLYSEMGYGKKNGVHLNMLRKFTSSLGLTEEDLKKIKPIPEVKDYIDSLGEIFLNSDYREAIGAEFGVEITAAPEFTFLYPGIQKYKQFSEDDIIFFKFHLAEEQLHGDWLTEAVSKIANSDEDKKLIKKGALMAAELWGNFWDGMYRYVCK